MTTTAMLPGPPNRSNGGSIDCSPGGLLAYGSGSTVVVADPRSMQLLCVLPMPSSSSNSNSSSYTAAYPLPTSSSSNHSAHSNLASFVTSVRWTPQPLPHDDLISSTDDDLNPVSSYSSSTSPHLLLAAGDRQGRIALWDLRDRQILLWFNLQDANVNGTIDGGGGGIQDLCWIRGPHGGWLLASIHGPSLLVLWEVASAPRCIWMYDAAPEYLSCLRRDPFDARHLCALGLRGLLLSAVPLAVPAVGEADVSLQGHRVPGPTDASSELQKLQAENGKEAASSSSPALAAFPLFLVRFCFSPLWRHILFLSFPRELIVFDLQYGATLSVTPLPRGWGKFSDVMSDPDLDLLYCAHLDGKLSIWKRKE